MSDGRRSANAQAASVDLAAIFKAMPPGAVLTALETVLAQLPVELIEVLASRHFQAGAITRRRNNQRDDCYRAMAQLHMPTASANALAAVVIAELSHYRSGRWRFERDGAAPANPHRALMHRILSLDRATILTARSVRAILAGLPVGKN